MRSNSLICTLIIFTAVLAIAVLGFGRVYAHCDGMDGPVVKAAQKALDTKNVNSVLIWVQKEDEAEMGKTFERTLEVREFNPQAKELGDMYFFETLVRIHRAGEGAPYTGLKPAGRDLGPAIPTADKAIEDGSGEPLLKLLSETVQNGVKEKFQEVIAKKSFDKDNVAVGREYVKAYVEFVHYIERLYQSAKTPSHGHFKEAEETEKHKEEHQ